MKNIIEKFVEALQREKLATAKIGGSLTDYIELQEVLRFTDEYVEKGSAYTSTKPALSGYYWLRKFKFKDDRYVEEARIVYCHRDHFTQQIEDILFMGNDGRHSPDDLEYGEWCGPIEEAQ